MDGYASFPYPSHVFLLKNGQSLWTLTGFRTRGLKTPAVCSGKYCMSIETFEDFFWLWVDGSLPRNYRIEFSFVLQEGELLFSQGLLILCEGWENMFECCFCFGTFYTSVYHQNTVCFEKNLVIPDEELPLKGRFFISSCTKKKKKKRGYMFSLGVSRWVWALRRFDANAKGTQLLWIVALPCCPCRWPMVCLLALVCVIGHLNTSTIYLIWPFQAVVFNFVLFSASALCGSQWRS